MRCTCLAALAVLLGQAPALPERPHKAAQLLRRVRLHPVAVSVPCLGGGPVARPTRRMLTPAPPDRKSRKPTRN